MIATIIIVSLALVWLGKETDWLRVRLLIGLKHDAKRMPWGLLKPLNTKKNDPFWLRFPELMNPLCGLSWLENTMHIIPEYKIELICDHSKYTMNVSPEPKASELLRDAFRVIRNPYLKVRI